VLVGNTVANPASGFASQKGFGYAASTGKVEIATDANAAVMELGKNNSNDGSILVFRKQGNVVGTINNSGTNLGIEGQSGIVFLGGDRTGSVRAINSHGSGQPRLDANNDNTTDLGTGANRFKDLYLSGGVHLGGTGSANKLDDYEEGVYDATISCASGSITLYTSYTRLRYTKIGRQVSSPSGATNLNLPFSSANDTNRSGVANNIMTGFFNGSAVTNGIYPIYGNIEEASSNCRLFIMLPPTTNNIGDNHVAAGSDIHVNFTYTVQ
jgi:hypothetical protein